MSKSFYDPSIKYELMEINENLRTMNGLLLQISSVLASTLTAEQLDNVINTISELKEQVGEEKEQ